MHLFKQLNALTATCMMFAFWLSLVSPASCVLAQDQAKAEVNADAEIVADEKAAPQPKEKDEAQPDDSDDKVLARNYRKALLIDVRGPIFSGLKSYVDSRLESARQGKCDLIILRITSPGGELDASLELSRKLSEIDWATTIAFVPESAYSGAAIMALGCDRIYMRPRALIGDAGPIRFHGGVFEHADEKIVSALAAALREIADGQDRPGAVAEAMVDRKLNVYEARDKKTGELSFLTEKETEIEENKQRFDIGPALPECGQNRFLTVSGSRAVELKLCEGTFDSERELLNQLRIDSLRETQRTWVDHVVYILNLPAMSVLLLLVGLIALYLEFSMPGLSVAGLTSICCFALFFWSHALGGTSGWLEVMLFAIGIGCLGVELFILPGLGVFGLTGGLMILVSLVMASQDFVFPNTNVQWTILRNNLLIVLGAMGLMVGALIVQIMYFDSIPALGRFRLATPDDQEGPVAAIGSGLAIGKDGLALPDVGATGVADSVLRPAGKVRFEQRVVDVVTEGDFLDAGTSVEVVRREGNRVVVRRIGT